MDPCVDFYEFACGTYLSEHELAETESRHSAIYDVLDMVTEDSREILESPASSDDADSVAKMKSAHAACMDEDTVESLGYADLLDILVNDGGAGFPLLVGADWDPSDFVWEEVAGANARWDHINENWYCTSTVEPA